LLKAQKCVFPILVMPESSTPDVGGSVSGNDVKAPTSNHSESLKVLEAYTRDLARAIARIDAGTAAKIGAQSGDILQIESAKITHAMMLPLYPQDESKSIVRLDSLVRENAGDVNIGDTILVRKLSNPPMADHVIVVPLEAIPPIDERYLGDALNGMVITVGDRLKIPYFGGRLEFRVIAIAFAPRLAAIVNQKTRFSITEDANGPINCIVQEYFRQEPDQSLSFANTGIAESPNVGEDKFFLGLKLEVKCGRTIAETVYYQRRLSQLEAEASKLTSLVNYCKEIAGSEVKAANQKLFDAQLNDAIKDYEKASQNQSRISDKGNRQLYLPLRAEKEVRSVLTELKYRIVNRWANQTSSESP